MGKFNATAPIGEERIVSEKLRYQWMQFVLQETQIDFDDCFTESQEELTIEQKAKLRKILEINDITIKDNYDGSIEIYVENEKIAFWDKPYFIIHFDKSKIKKNEQKYVEIQFNCWSVFDKEE